MQPYRTEYMLREVHSAGSHGSQGQSSLNTASVQWQTLLVTDTQGMVDSLLRLADNMVGRRGAGRVRLLMSISSLLTAEHPCLHTCPKPEHLHLAQHRGEESAVTSRDQWPWSEHTHLTFRQIFAWGHSVSGGLCLSTPSFCFLGVTMGCH